MYTHFWNCVLFLRWKYNNACRYIFYLHNLFVSITKLQRKLETCARVSKIWNYINYEKHLKLFGSMVKYKDINYMLLTEDTHVFICACLLYEAKIFHIEQRGVPEL